VTHVDRKIRFAARARKEFEDATYWYEAKRKGLGAQFVLVVEAKLDSIRKSPELFPSVYKFQRAVVKRFPFAIFFEVVDDNIHVIAMYHTSREPQVFDDPS
jgi:toxin ParE1/3/4